MASSKVQETWQTLLESAQQCQAVFEDIKREIIDPDQLKYVLALAAQHLPGNNVAMSIPVIIQKRLEQIQSREIRILMAGEISVGKSSLLNLLMKGKYLPVRFNKTTRVFCELHDCLDRKAVFKFVPTESQQPRDESLLLETDQNWKYLQDSIKTRKYNGKDLRKVVIKWPLDVQQVQHEGPEHETALKCVGQDSTTMSVLKEFSRLEVVEDTNVNIDDNVEGEQDGVTVHSRHPSVLRDGDEERDEFKTIFVDTPGITSDHEVFEEIQSHGANYQGFILVMKEADMRKEGLETLIEDIEKSMKQGTDMMNPESALFIFNHFDLVPEFEQDEIKKEVKTHILRKWPQMDPKSIVFMSARKELIYNDNDGHQTVSADFGTRVRDFVTKVIRISIEEHCLWMLNLLEVMHAVTTANKQWKAINHTRTQLDQNLSQYLQEAIALSEDLNLSPDDLLKDLYEETGDKLKQHLDIDLTWEEQEINRAIPDVTIDWNDLTDQVNGLICEKILQEKSKEIEYLRETFKRKCENIYGNIFTRLKKIESCLEGMMYKDDTAGVLKEGIAVAVMPALLGGAIRLAPLAAPFMLLALPLLPISLVVKSFIDDYQDYKNDKERENLKGNKVAFFKQRQRDLSRIFSDSLNTQNFEKTRKSPIFCKLFGEFPKQVMLLEVDRLIKTIQMLQRRDPSLLKADSSLCNKYLARMMEVYTNGVLLHNIESARIHWVKDREGRTCPIGSNGPNGCVYKAKLNLTGSFSGTTDVAVKELTYERRMDSSPASSLHSNLDIYREYFLLRQLSYSGHENIVKFHGSSFVSEEVENVATSKLRLVFELCDGTLDDVVRQQVNTENERFVDFRWYSQGIMEGLKFLHEKNIVHRDLKPSNCLLRKTNKPRRQVKLADFGASKQMDLICTAAQNIGTPSYWAPEVVKSTSLKYHSKASDVYSLGLVCWELWFRKHAYDEYRIMQGEIPTRYPGVTPVKELLQLCFIRRANIVGLLNQLEKIDGPP